MVTYKSYDYYEIISALLCDVQTLHSEVFTHTALKHTLLKVRKRVASEGNGFLTKALPRLGKAFDKALSGQEPLDCTKLGFATKHGTQLPMFMWELFRMVLNSNGELLSEPCAKCVKSLRTVLYLFYKLELPYHLKQEHEIIERFTRTEQEVTTYNNWFNLVADGFDASTNGMSSDQRGLNNCPPWFARTILIARRRLERLFSGFNEHDIAPRHGPGVVSTKEILWEKYRFDAIPQRIVDVYPEDAYFKASLGHVCDTMVSPSGAYQSTETEPFAKVCLVPKDSRGPRLISCEPKDFQWVQQGLSRAIVDHVERHPLTKWEVRFTDQQPNRLAAFQGSKHGRYSTLDLKDASDRVSLGLVRLLFPGHVFNALSACRSLGTELPDGSRLELRKYAPMGSALCFPVMALTIWALLKSGLECINAHPSFWKEEAVYVYGDDVIVQTAIAEHAMIILESFGLKINRDKSCTKGSFRESCGMDAFLGTDVTPVRIRTPWSSTRCPDTFTSYIAYANTMWERGYYRCYHTLVDWLTSVYDGIPSRDLGISQLSLPLLPSEYKAPKSRVNPNLQKLEYRVRDTVPLTESKELDGWSMLLRFFAERGHRPRPSDQPAYVNNVGLQDPYDPFAVREYTWPHRNKLRWCWR